MDIFDFIIANHRPRGAWSKSNCPDVLNSIVYLFDDIKEIYKDGRFPVDDIFLIQSHEGNRTNIVTSDKSVVVFDVQQLSNISQTGEICSFGSVDQDSTLSLFHELWSASSRSLDMFGELDEATTMRIRFKIHPDENHIRSISERFRSSSLLAHYSKIDNFERFFEVVACFIICHEVAHRVYSQRSSDDIDEFVSDLPRLSNTETYSVYLRSQLDKIDFEKLSGMEIEEIYCDLHAFNITLKICCELNFVPLEMLPLAFSFMFGSIIASSNINSPNQTLNLLNLRSTLIQSYCLSSLELNTHSTSKADDNIIGEYILSGGRKVGTKLHNFSLVQSLQDYAIRKICVSGIRQGLFKPSHSPSTLSEYADRITLLFSPVYLDQSLGEKIKETSLIGIINCISDLTDHDDWYRR